MPLQSSNSSDSQQSATWDAAAVSADATGVLKEQASAKLKRADIENEKYEQSKPKLHGVLSGMTTRDVDERIAKIGIVGYWATSISTVRSTVLSKISDKHGFISGFGH